MHRNTSTTQYIHHHACRVLVPGRHHELPIRLNVEFDALYDGGCCSSIQEWGIFLLFPTVSPLPHLVVASDASGSHGSGARRPHSALLAHGLSYLVASPRHKSIELVPIVVTTHLRRHGWSRPRLQFLCDNVAVVDILNSGTSWSPVISMTLEACRHSFVFSAAHTPRRDNAIADALFRFRFAGISRLAPNEDSLPRPIPPTLLPHLVPPA